jgi:hypothetical protein
VAGTFAFLAKSTRGNGDAQSRRQAYPGEPSLLIAACTTAMDKELRVAAESYLSRLSAAVAAISVPVRSQASACAYPP